MAAIADLAVLIRYGYYWAVGLGVFLLIVPLISFGLWKTRSMFTLGKTFIALTSGYAAAGGAFAYMYQSHHSSSRLWLFIVYMVTSYIFNLTSLVLAMLEVAQADIDWVSEDSSSVTPSMC